MTMPSNEPHNGEASVIPLSRVRDAHRLPLYKSTSHDLSRIDMPSHWAVPWSDLMMVMMVMFAVMLAVKLAEQDMREMFTPPVEAQQAQGKSNPPEQHPAQSPEAHAPTQSPQQAEPFGAISEPAQTQAEADQKLPSDQVDTNLHSAEKSNSQGQISPEEILRRSNQLISQANLTEVDVALTDNNAVKVSVRGNLLFDLGRADLKPDAIRFLNELSKIIAANNFMIEIVGHTDNFPVSNPAYPTNWELSSARASRVARYLIQTGKLEPGRFTVIGQSYYRPAVPNDSLANKAKNRRVEIIITRQEFTP